MSKAEKMRARLATMAKEREDFVAQKQQLEAEMRNSSLGKPLPSMAAAGGGVVDQQSVSGEDSTAIVASAPSNASTPRPQLRRRPSGVGIDSSSPSSSQAQLSPYNSSQNLQVGANPTLIIPGGTRVSEWAYSVNMSMTGDSPPVVKVNEVYETVRNLGRGAFGDVFLCRNIEDSRMFADKTIFCEKESLLTDVLRELFFLRKYRHPYIIDIHDGFVIAQPRVLHIIMSYCEAGDLGKVISLHRKNKSNIAEVQACKWMLQIALAMAFLHENGVLHRDLKPCNVMLTEGGELCKVCDFGLALEASGDDAALPTSEAGTPYYTAPEMIQGKNYSFPADCWSFGVMIHELLALSRPFEGASTADLVKAILLEAPPSCPAHYSESLRCMVLGFLVKDPAARMGFAGLLTESPLAARVSALPQSYRPKALEERIKRAHVKHLVGQIEMLTQSKKSSLRGMPSPSLAAAEAAAAEPAIVIVTGGGSADLISSVVVTKGTSTSPFQAIRKTLSGPNSGSNTPTQLLRKRQSEGRIAEGNSEEEFPDSTGQGSGAIAGCGEEPKVVETSVGTDNSPGASVRAQTHYIDSQQPPHTGSEKSSFSSSSSIPGIDAEVVVLVPHPPDVPHPAKGNNNTNSVVIGASSEGIAQPHRGVESLPGIPSTSATLEGEALTKQPAVEDYEKSGVDSDKTALAMTRGESTASLSRKVKNLHDALLLDQQIADSR